jgi:hypothetical protein
VLAVLLAASAMAIAFLAGFAIAPLLFESRFEPRISARQAVLQRQLDGLENLVARAERGPLVPLGDGQAVLIVDEELVRSLLGALVPAEHVIAGRYRVRVSNATVAFEDGFALVRLDGRASLRVGDGEVFADVSVFGGLEVLRAQPSAEALRARINVVAVEAQQLDVPVAGRGARQLAEALARLKLQEFAVLASSLQIPVRHEHAFQVPAVGPQGPVRIKAAVVPFRLSVLEMTAFHGKLFVSMAAGSDATASDQPPGAPAAPAPLSGDPATLIARLEELHRERHARLEALVEDDPFLHEAVRVKADLALAVRADFARDVIREVARSYLDRVDLKLGGIEVEKQGTLRRDTFLGRIRAGDWAVGLRIHEIRGILRAGEPEVGFLEGNRVALTFPVHLEQGEGRASVDFRWDSRGIANLVCRDFEASQEIHGVVVPEAYPVRGSFALAAEAGSLTARPAFPDEFRVKLDLAPGSWSAIRATLEEQDRFLKCGMALDVEKVIGQLRDLAGNGFDVRVPARVFRTVVLPAQIAESVNVGGYELGVAASRTSLHTCRNVLWYSASVGVRVPASLRARLPRLEPVPLRVPFSVLQAGPMYRPF